MILRIALHQAGQSNRENANANMNTNTRPIHVMRSLGFTARMASSRRTRPATMASQADEYEQRNVHDVYQHIAKHFSSTRYKVCVCVCVCVVFCTAWELSPFAD